MDWIDARDGKDWSVFNYTMMPEMGNGGSPEGGLDRIRFEHPPEPASADEVYSIPNPEQLRVREIGDTLLQKMLDEARKVEA
ncbi:MAG: hypothetical protein ACOC8K_08950 [Gemmatimonadota bacterium]